MKFTDKKKLQSHEEIGCGIIGGSLSCWNQPFEVSRIYMQSAKNEGKANQNLYQVMKTIVAEQGAKGLFKGIIPRMLLGAYQTVFMVSGKKIIDG